MKGKNLHSVDDKLSCMIESLEEHQLRQVLHHLTVIHPDAVEVALNNVVRNDDSFSAETEQMTNLTGRMTLGFSTRNRSVSGGDMKPGLLSRSAELDSGDTAQPPTRKLPPTKAPPQSRVLPEKNTASRLKSLSNRTALVQAQPVSENHTPPRPSVPLPAPGGVVVAYLIYEPASSGKLILHYSTSPLANAIGAWSPGAGKSIPGFKVKENGGRSDLIGNCAGGVAGRKNYFSGWCQYVRAAKGLNGCVTLLEPPTFVGLPVDVYVYMNESHSQTVKFQPGVPVDVSNILAVAALPKHTSFYSNSITIDIMKWLGEASGIGASSML